VRPGTAFCQRFSGRLYIKAYLLKYLFKARVVPEGIKIEQVYNQNPPITLIVGPLMPQEGFVQFPEVTIDLGEE